MEISIEDDMLPFLVFFRNTFVVHTLEQFIMYSSILLHNLFSLFRENIHTRLPGDQSRARGVVREGRGTPTATPPSPHSATLTSLGTERYKLQ
jgi:hypothetical protein